MKSVTMLFQTGSLTLMSGLFSVAVAASSDDLSSSARHEAEDIHRTVTHEANPPCGKSTRPDLTGSARCSPDSTWSSVLEAGLQIRTFTQNGLKDPRTKHQRRYLQYIPALLHKDKRYPLLIALHGANVSAEFFRYSDTSDRFERLADHDHFIVVYANAAYAKGATQDTHPEDPFWANGGYWRTCLGPPTGPDRMVDDVDYLRRVIRNLKMEGVPIDDERIYVIGISNGGEMAQRVAREMGSELAGLAMVVPVLGLPASEALGECGVGRQHPLSVLHIYSRLDPLLTWVWDTYFPPGSTYADDMEKSGRLWRKQIGAGENPIKATSIKNSVYEGRGYSGDVPWALATRNSGVVRYDYAASPSGASYVAFVIDHGGHAWPAERATDTIVAAGPGRIGFRNQDFNAADVIWKFFKDKKRIRSR